MAETLSPEQLQFIASIKDLRFLVSDPSSGRKSIRKLLSHFQVKPSQVDYAEHFTDAQAMLIAKKPNVIFAEQNQNGESGLFLLDLQRKCLGPNEIQVFFLITSKDSPTMMTGAADENVDCILLKPFTFGGLLQSFETTLARCVKPTPFDSKMKSGLSLFKSDKFEEALLLFQESQILNPKSALPLAWQGSSHFQLKRIDLARTAFEKGLQLEPTHYRCITGLLGLFIQSGNYPEAYKLGQLLAANHTIPVKLIPDLIRVSIGNNTFTDVLSFYQNADILIQMDPYAAIPLSAGLVVCGLYFLRKSERDAALDAFRKAEVCARGNAKILRRILIALIESQFEKEAAAFLNRIPDEVKNAPEVQIAELELLEKAGATPADILNKGLDLLHNGADDLKIFLLVIKKSKEAGRAQKHTDDIIQKALMKHPQAKDLLS